MVGPERKCDISCSLNIVAVAKIRRGAIPSFPVFADALWSSTPSTSQQSRILFSKPLSLSQADDVESPSLPFSLPRKGGHRNGRRTNRPHDCAHRPVPVLDASRRRSSPEGSHGGRSCSGRRVGCYPPKGGGVGEGKGQVTIIIDPTATIEEAGGGGQSGPCHGPVK